MKRFSLFLMGVAAIALGHAPAAKADDLALNFDPSEATVVPGQPPTDQSAVPEVNPQRLSDPIGLPSGATSPPVQPFSLAKEDQLPPPPPQPEPVMPEASYTSGVDLAASSREQSAPETPPAPGLSFDKSSQNLQASQTSQQSLERPAEAQSPAIFPASTAPTPILPAPVENGASAAAPVTVTGGSATKPNQPVELNFDRASTQNPVNNSVRSPSEEAVSTENLDANQTNFSLDSLFQGGSDSLVARIVGSAEGTRTADGQRTRAYYGHSDPGNGVWNLGSFSYQHGASSPEEADEKQLKRLRRQTDKLAAIASDYQLEMTLEEKLNGIDLANQSPRAALDRGGYVERLAEARKQNLQGEDAILWARVRSYLDPDTQRWNAPGLGNTVNGITHDQERRMRAIARALTSFQQEMVIAQQSPKPERLIPAHSVNSPAVAPMDDGTTVAQVNQTTDLQTEGAETQSSESRLESDRPLSNLIASALDRLMSIDL